MSRTLLLTVGLTIVATSDLLGNDVLQHHLNATRDGLFIDPSITRTAAANTHCDPTFVGPVLPSPSTPRLAHRSG